jgi:hypothetical protein
MRIPTIRAFGKTRLAAASISFIAGFSRRQSHARTRRVFSNTANMPISNPTTAPAEVTIFMTESQVMSIDAACDVARFELSGGDMNSQINCCMSGAEHTKVGHASQAFLKASGRYRAQSSKRRRIYSQIDAAYGEKPWRDGGGLFALGPHLTSPIQSSDE